MSSAALFDTVRSVAFGSITASYTPLGLPFGHATRILHFINDTNGTYMLSDDGINDKVPVLDNGFTLYDVTSDQDANEKLRFSEGTQWYIKYLSVPTLQANSSNTFYLTTIYGKGE